MAIPNLNFRGSIKSQGGRFASSSARKVVNEQFKGLSSEAKAYLIDKLDSGKIIHATDFSKIITEAHKKGYISGAHAEQIKDTVKLPDKGKYKGVDFNDHWE